LRVNIILKVIKLNIINKRLKNYRLKYNNNNNNNNNNNRLK